MHIGILAHEFRVYTHTFIDEVTVIVDAGGATLSLTPDEAYDLGMRLCAEARLAKRLAEQRAEGGHADHAIASI